MNDTLGGMGSGAAAGSSFGPWGAAIGAALGLVQGEEKRREAAKQRNFESVKTAMSPWSKLGGGEYVQNPSTMGGMLQGGLAGASLGQNLQSMDMQKQLMDQQKNYLYQQQMGQMMQGQKMPAVGTTSSWAGMNTPYTA